MHVRQVPRSIGLGFSLAVCLTANACTHKPAGTPFTPPALEGQAGAGAHAQGGTGGQPRAEGGGDPGPGPFEGEPTPGTPIVPGSTHELALPAESQAELAALREKLAALEGLTKDQLLARHPLEHKTELGYDPKTAGHMDLIQSSGLALDDRELAKLGEQGFVIVPRRAFPNMLYGYQTIYAVDLPVYVSVDSIMDAVHVSYDVMLKQVEEAALSGELELMLEKARELLRAGAVADAKTAADLDLFLAVPLQLLTERSGAPVAGADAKTVSSLVEKARAANGFEKLELFGVDRTFDFSQFKPRGHYTDSEGLTRYFRAMMWLGRTDFRLIETGGDGKQVFHRRQFDSVVALRDLIAGEGREAYDHIDRVVSAFVGEHDYMQLSEIDGLLADLGASSAATTQALDDATIAETIVAKGYGAQRIASQVIWKEPQAGSATLPLSRSFALLGQRYAVDSHVFSNVVFDRVPEGASGPRWLPDPLDAAYAALANPAALPLLAPQLERYGYAPQLEQTRVLIDEHGAEFWSKNLYNLWLSTLRALSPGEEVSDPGALGMPLVTGTAPWARRMLNAQLGSWAQLRHDTILYVKQSYTTGAVCEFPDAYVDPYPEAYARLALFARHGKGLADVLASGSGTAIEDSVRQYFEELESIADILREMAEYQRAGTPFNETMMAFINDAVRTDAGGVCGAPPTFRGWYTRLLYGNAQNEMDPTIADVHTDPNGPSVLHVATGLPRLMVVTTDSCEGPRAYAGLTFAYHEVVTDLNRLTDPEWETMARNASPPDVPWMSEILP